MSHFVPLQTFVRNQAAQLGQSVIDADFDAQEREACLAAAARELGEACVTADEVFEFVVTEYADQIPAMLRGIADCNYAHLNTFFRRAFERLADKKAEEIRCTVV
jgi:hypothetical protein